MEVKSKIINDSSIISSNSEQEKQEFNQFNFYKELVKYIIIEYKKASNNQGEKVKEVKYENIEDYSLYIKKKFQSIFTIKEKPNDKSINDYSNVEKSVFLNKTKNKAKLDKVPNLVENLMAKARLLDTVGISLGKIEWLKVKKALESLVTKEVLVIKFWGKIYGKYNDYYIIQMERKENKSLITKYSPNKPDPSGIVGANQYLFYASNHLLENWIELPEVSGEQIKISRLFKYLFSGNLSAKVDSFVPFPGNEAHLLKCCILRIMHSTSIVPDGYLEIKQIDKSLETYGIELSDKITQVKEDFTLTSTNEEMSAPERWVHQYAYISDKGKIIDIVPEESPPARLQTIAQDKPIYETKPLWYFKEIGDKMQYTTTQGGNITYSSLVIKNNFWPGSTTVYRQGEFTTIYLGNGNRQYGSIYYPYKPGEIENDPEGLSEYREPNPDKEPEIIESDSDRENEEMEMNDGK